mgnify:CR=1 FL=1
MADCKICNIINKKIEAKIVYEDAAVMAILSDEPTIFGHLLVFPKQHNLTLEEVDDKVVIRKILPLSVSYDHRLIDGATASRFMVDLMALLVEPKKIK